MYNHTVPPCETLIRVYINNTLIKNWRKKKNGHSLPQGLPWGEDSSVRVYYVRDTHLGEQKEELLRHTDRIFPQESMRLGFLLWEESTLRTTNKPQHTPGQGAWMWEASENQVFRECYFRIWFSRSSREESLNSWQQLRCPVTLLLRRLPLWRFLHHQQCSGEASIYSHQSKPQHVCKTFISYQQEYL